ncbi:hypothetical protein [Proteiniclasticum sp.]|uniref:hypothetical protein n=1 Tax=Proteiniclasticum sp. TaxID=2053595 RepID=UPI002899E197|nr:hypothetical protein [Proteiniclasticum sp.]
MESYIYLVFTKTGTWLSRVIATFSDMKYVHASISFDDSFTKMYSFGRTNPDNPFSGGFVEEDLKGGVYQKYTEARCLIYKVKVTKLQYDSLKKELAKFQNEADKYHYNLIGLVGAKFGIPLKRKHHYFCSQFVSELLINCRIYDMDKEPEIISPSDLYSIDNLELLYEGYASMYAGEIDLEISENLKTPAII